MKLKGGYYKFEYDIKGKSWKEVKKLLYELFRENEDYMRKYV